MSSSLRAHMLPLSCQKMYALLEEDIENATSTYITPSLQ